MTPLDEWRAVQRDDVTYPSDAALLAFLRSVEPGQAALDRGAGMTPVELRMVSHTTGIA